MKLTLIQTLTVVISLVVSVLGGYSTEEMIKLTQNRKTKTHILTEQNFEKFLAGPRDYHIIMLLSSTSPQFNCPLCVEFKPEYEMVANSWFQDHPDGIGKNEGKDIFFFYSEFTGAKTLFQKMKLNNIPKLFHLPPSAASSSDAWVGEVGEYQFFQGKHSDIIVEWLRGITGHKFNVYVPVNYNRVIVNAIITFGLCLLFRIFYKQFKAFLVSKLLWTGVSLLTTLLFTSGYMFTQIRQAPYVREHPDGHVDYFMQGQQTQLGVETQIVSVCYGALSLLFVVLVKKVPELSHPKVKLIAAGLITASIYVGFSLLLSFFGLKSPGYPYRFLKFFV